MSELERLVVLIAMGQVGSAEAEALLEVVGARCESARNYHKTRRGIDALERVRAKEEGRDPDYTAARDRAALEN